MHGKRKQRDADGEDELPLAKRQVVDLPTLRELALATCDAIEQAAKKWYSNFNNWQTLHDPGLEANRALMEETKLMPPRLDSRLFTISLDTQTTIHKKIDRRVANCLPTFCGTNEALSFKAAPPLVFFLGPRYVQQLLIAMGVYPQGCLQLVADYYNPKCTIILYAMTMDFTPKASVEQLYLLDVTDERNEEFIDQLADEFLERFGRKVTYQPFCFHASEP